MILQGMVLLLVLIHPLVSQTGDLVCIRAFFRVEGKAAAGADRQKTACNMIGRCNSLTDKLDLAALQLYPFRFPLFAENSRWLCSILDFRSAPRPHR